MVLRSYIMQVPDHEPGPGPSPFDLISFSSPSLVCLRQTLKQPLALHSSLCLSSAVRPDMAILPLSTLRVRTHTHMARTHSTQARAFAPAHTHAQAHALARVRAHTHAFTHTSTHTYTYISFNQTPFQLLIIKSCVLRLIQENKGRRQILGAGAVICYV